MIPLPAQGQDSHGLGGMPGTGCQGADAAFQVGDPFFQHVAGRIHDAGINIPRFFQRKQPRGMIGILKNIRAGLVNGNSKRDRLPGLDSGRHEAGGWKNRIGVHGLVLVSSF